MSEVLTRQDRCRQLIKKYQSELEWWEGQVPETISQKEIKENSIVGLKKQVKELELDIQVADAIETYHKTIKNCLEHEYPEWIKAVNSALETGKEEILDSWMWLEWVKPAYLELKKTFKPAKADTVK